MADEAVLRIVLDDDGGNPPAATGTPAPSAEHSPHHNAPAHAGGSTPPRPATIPPLITDEKLRRLDAWADKLSKSLDDASKRLTENLGKSRYSGTESEAELNGEEAKLRAEVARLTDSLSDVIKATHGIQVKPPQPEAADISVTPPAQPKSEPVPVDIVKPPDPAPPPAATPGTRPPPGPRDWMRDLIDGIAGANRHVLVEGESGSGKSSLTRNIAFERAQKGEEVNVLDPHKPEMWKGVNKVFTRESARDFSDMMLETLRSREAASVEARAKGESINFAPITFALSDFAAIAKDFPALKDTMQTVLTEGRKFNVAVLAETAGFNAEEIGAGTAAMRRNFKQKVQAFAPGPGEPDRTVQMGKDVFKTPDLSHATDENKARFDPSIVQYKPSKPPEPPPPEFDPMEVAKKRIEAEERRAAVDAEYAKLKPKPPPDTAKVKSGFDQLVDSVGSLRGALGGTLGRIVGAALDITAKVRAMRAKAVEADPGRSNTGAGSTAADIAAKFRPSEAARGAWQDSPKGKPGNPLAALYPPPNAPAAPAAVPPPPEPEPAPKPGLLAAGLPLVDDILKLDKGVKDAVKGVIGGIGGMAHALTSPDDNASKTIQSVANAVSGLGSALPVVGIPLVVVGEGLKVVAGLMDNFTKMAEKYAEYNPAIAQAQAMIEMQKIMSDMRRAQQSGPELVKLMKAQAEMQQQFEDIKMKIWMRILPILTAILKAVGGLLAIAEDDQKFVDFEDPTELILKKAGEALKGAEIPLSAPRDVIGVA